MVKHNFDELVNRKGTECKKWDTYADDVIPMWIADTDFKCPQPVIDALVKRAEHGVYGYPVNCKKFEQSIANWQKKDLGGMLTLIGSNIHRQLFLLSYMPCVLLPILVTIL